MLSITIGCPGAGKSTWAEQSLPPQTLRLERDRFRECLFGSRKAYHSHHFDTDLRSEVVTQSMLSAMMYWPVPDWAITDTGLREQSVKPFLAHALRVEEPVELVIFDRPLALLLERNETRPEEHRVPEQIIRTFHEEFNDPAAWWRKWHPCRIIHV